MGKEIKIKYMPIAELKAYENNPRNNDEAVPFVANSIKEFGFKNPVIIDADNVIVAGHTRVKAAKSLGMKKVPCIVADDLTPEQIRAFRLADNKTAEIATWDAGKLDEELRDILDIDMNNFGFDIDDLEKDFDSATGHDGNKETHEIKNKFLFFPLSILSARGGAWQDRKKEWINLGIKSYESRQGMKTGTSYCHSVPNYYSLKDKCEKDIGRKLTLKEFDTEYIHKYYSGLYKTTDDHGILSIFDPVLAELMYTWFCPVGGEIIDPFAGGSVRGIVAAKLGYKYTGVDLRKDQIDANVKNAKEILSSNIPRWICGNSLKITDIAPGEYDFVFSCPPYFDLEKYSDDKEDLSNQTYEDFVSMYREIIKKSISMLKENRFACFVVGEIRDKKTGMYRNFVPETIRAFVDAGALFYNEIILATPVGSVATVGGYVFNKSRKIGKVHQNVLVFYKGDPKQIGKTFGAVPMADIKEFDDETL